LPTTPAIQALIQAAETAPGRFAKTSWGSTRVRHTAAHEALIASFEAEGWNRQDAEYKAYRFRAAFPHQTDAERLAIRERALAQIVAERAKASALRAVA
jgi:hypothetical protein